MSSPEHYVIGVDFGTLSGRAVVVRVGDGAELGSAVHEYRHGVLERAPRRRRASRARRCRRTGRCRSRTTTSTCCSTRCQRRCATSGIDPADVIGIGTDFTACTVLPVARRRHAAVRGARAGRPAARLRQALEAPRGAAPRRPDQRARRRAWRAVAGPLRRQDLVGVGVRQGSAAARGGSRRLPANRALGRGRRLDRVAAHRRLRPQRLHRRLQGDLPGRRLPVARTSSPRSTRTSPAS